jgi:type IV pilus assembly protein PilY1
VTRLATLTAPDGTAQPITTKPELGEVSANRVVFLGTGKFLGASDKASTQRQSVYAIKDAMNSVAAPAVTMTRGGAFPTSTITDFVRQDLTASPTNPTTERTVATVNPVDFTSASVSGWFIDLPDGATGGNGSERVNVDPILQLGTLVMPSNVPSTDTCVAGGFGWINFLDFKTGGFIPGSTANMASTKIAASLVVGINVVQLPGGTIKTIVTTADNQQLTKDTPVAPSTLQGRRVSWRELFFE